MLGYDPVSLLFGLDLPHANAVRAATLVPVTAELVQLAWHHIFETV